MSGTSLDGADAALVDFGGEHPRTLAFATVSFDDALRRQLADLSRPGSDSLDLAGAVSIALADIYVRAVEDAIRQANVDRRTIRGIGVHGQTVRHRPAAGFTTQLNDPARVAEHTGLEVVADFR